MDVLEECIKPIRSYHLHTTHIKSLRIRAFIQFSQFTQKKKRKKKKVIEQERVKKGLRKFLLYFFFLQLNQGLRHYTPQGPNSLK